MNFQINAKGIITDTVALTDYQMVAKDLAKVVISFTGNHDKHSIAAAITKQTDYKTAAVENSFRLVKAGVAVGFLRANKVVRSVNNEHELRASYRVMGSSNILMDNKDKSLWEVKQGKAGKYLARHGNEDLSELIECSASRRSDVPSLQVISMANATPSEFVAYADSNGDMDYGYCVNASRTKLQVVSVASNAAVIIPHSVVAQIYQIPILKSQNDKLVAAGLNRSEKDKEIEYYKRLYSYSPEYLAQVIDQINESSVA